MLAQIIDLLAILGQAAAATYALWGFFIMVMGLRRARNAGTLSRPATILGLPILWVGMLLDVTVNLLVAPFVFLELPREALVTSRLSRLVHEERGAWRGRLALWICAELLDAFDTDGHHCNCADLH